MKILIVDDEPLARARLQALVEELGSSYEIVADVSNGNEALSAAHAFQPEVILLDIRMPGMDGLEAAERFASQHPAPAVIFTTAYSEHAVEAFEHQAMDYLLKPIRKDRLEQALKRAYSFVQSQLSPKPPIGTPNARTHISYHFRGEVRLIPVNKIYYFLADRKYVVVHWQEGEALITDALKELEKEFAGQFLRIHRSTLVAMGQIRSLNKSKNGRSYIHLKALDESLEVSRRHLQNVKKLLKDMRLPDQ